MKRIITALAILLVSIGGFAQDSSDLAGTWTANISEKEAESNDDADVEMGLEATDNLTFTGNNYSEKTVFVMTIAGTSKKTSENVNMKLTVTGAIKGSWTLDGNVLTLTPDKKSKPVIDVQTSELPGMLKTLLVGPIKKELKSAIMEVSRYEVLSASATELVVKEIPDPKDKKASTEEPETVTYKKN